MSEREGYWRQLIERQAASGLAVSRFCEQQQISTVSFYAWRRRLAEQRPPTFLPVNVIAPVHRDASALELERGDGLVIRVFDGARRQTIVDVLAALSGESA